MYIDVSFEGASGKLALRPLSGEGANNGIFKILGATFPTGIPSDMWFEKVLAEIPSKEPHAFLFWGEYKECLDDRHSPLADRICLVLFWWSGDKCFAKRAIELDAKEMVGFRPFALGRNVLSVSDQEKKIVYYSDDFRGHHDMPGWTSKKVGSEVMLEYICGRASFDDLDASAAVIEWNYNRLREVEEANQRHMRERDDAIRERDNALNLLATAEAELAELRAEALTGSQT